MVGMVGKQWVGGNLAKTRPLYGAQLTNEIRWCGLYHGVLSELAEEVIV